MSDEKIRALINERKLRILLGGVAGAGKTTLARHLVQTWNIDHRYGTGGLREMARAYVTPESHPALFDHSFRPSSPEITPFENFCNGTEQMNPGITALGKRAKEQGTSLVVEGVYLLPGITSPEAYDFFFWLQKPGTDEGYDRTINSPSHSKRVLSPEDIRACSEIERQALAWCCERGAAIIPFGSYEERKDLIGGEILRSL